MTLYRGGSGMLSYYLHRVTGIGVLLFLWLHIVDIALVSWGPDLFNELLFIYHLPAFRVLQVGLVAAVLYHALNGIRILIIDFWDGAIEHYRLMLNIELVLFAAAFLPAAYFMLKPILAH
jgi:succinate dehydrogenase / fumarate reductase cytochrome b subunit